MSLKKYALKLARRRRALRSSSGISRWGVLIAFLILAIAGSVAVRFVYRRAASPSGSGDVSVSTAGSVQGSFALAPYVLGFDKPHTFLLLFLNNTEMRPGGGFIGSYGILKVAGGKILSFAARGSENLDWNAPADFKMSPPAPIQMYMNQPIWYFRDSNWSPDFKVSAENALRFYAAEGGADAQSIDGVFGVTPTVLKELMALAGPLHIDGTTYTAEKVVSDLEYHVEYGYKDTGQTKEDRKVIINQMGQELIRRLVALPPWRWGALPEVFTRMINQKQILLYAVDPDTQRSIENLGWAGRQAQTPLNTDFVQLVDANLASLKTDAVIGRAINYTIHKSADGWVGEISATYTHEGGYDWKTTRYRSFTRLYAPSGDALVSSAGFIDEVKTKKPMPAQVAAEDKTQSWGGFWFVDPKQSYALTWNFALSPAVQAQLNAGTYTLYAQKQLGMERATRLTVQVDFGTTIKRFEGDLASDRLIELKVR